jgi:hypothetical protein
VSTPATHPKDQPVDEDTIIDELDEMISRTQMDIIAADGKAAALLGWTGTMFALIAGFLSTADDSATGTSGGGLFTAATAIGVMALAGSVVALVMAVRPRLHGPSPRSFLHLATLDAAAVVDLAGDRIRSQVDPHTIAARAANLARIARRKYQYVRVATTLLVAATPTLAAATVAGALT